MSEKEKKPIYKKWWVWLITVVIVSGIINGFADPYDEEEEKEKQAVKEEQEEIKAAKEKEAKENKEEETIEVNEKIELGNIVIKLQNVYIKDGVLSFGFWWNRWASNDKVHFSVLAYPVVTQNGESLEYNDDNDTLLRKTEKGVDSRVDLKYELQDDSPVEIKFITSSDNPEEETIMIDEW